MLKHPHRPPIVRQPHQCKSLQFDHNDRREHQQNEVREFLERHSFYR